MRLKNFYNLLKTSESQGKNENKRMDNLKIRDLMKTKLYFIFSIMYLVVY